MSERERERERDRERQREREREREREMEAQRRGSKQTCKIDQGFAAALDDDVSVQQTSFKHRNTNKTHCGGTRNLLL